MLLEDLGREQKDSERLTGQRSGTGLSAELGQNRKPRVVSLSELVLIKKNMAERKTDGDIRPLGVQRWGWSNWGRKLGVRLQRGLEEHQGAWQTLGTHLTLTQTQM